MRYNFASAISFDWFSGKSGCEFGSSNQSQMERRNLPAFHFIWTIFCLNTLLGNNIIFQVWKNQMFRDLVVRS